MNTKKRIISVLLSFIMVFCNVSANVAFAVEQSSGQVAISVGKASAQPGKTVKVSVSIQGNPGIIGATLRLEYGQSAELVNAESGEAFSALNMTPPGALRSPCNFVWNTTSVSDNQIKNGTILDLTFKVSASAKEGEKIPVKISYDEGDVVDNDLHNVDATITNGYIEVDDYIPGDLDGNHKVNTIDVILLSRYLAGGYDVTIDKRAANVNADKKINTTDLIMICRYIAGGYDVELLRETGDVSVSEHKLEKTEFAAATCTEDGHIAYWKCTDCGKYFSDAEGVHEITEKSIEVPATGHTIVTDPAVQPTATTPGLTEGSHCSICGTVIVAQKPWNDNFFELRYDIANGDSYLSTLEIENNNPATIKEGATLWLVNPSVPGYQFLGWYDGAGDDAARVQKIENADHSMQLYAHWKPITYQIQFKSDLDPVPSAVYTTKEGKVLPTPKLDGYTFVGWTGLDGKEYKRIKPGTTGDITLYANWLSERNQAWAKKKLGDPFVYEDGDYILYAYEIGEVRNVPVYTVEDFGKINSDGVTQTVTKKYTVTTQETLMKSYAKALQKATTDSATWTLSKDWTDSISINKEYCEQHGISYEEAVARSKSESGNWYVSNSQGGGYSQSIVDSNDTYALHTENNNTKSWSDDYSQSVSHGDDVKTLNTKNHTDGSTWSDKENISAQLGSNNGPAHVSAGYERTDTGNHDTTTNTGTETTTRGNDTTTMKGKAFDNASSDQTGSVFHHSNNTTNSRTWNTETGYGGSSSASQSESISKALSTLISSKTGYGSSYINKEGETSSQGMSSTTSQSDQYSSSVTYSKLTSEEKDITYTTSNTKSGYHRWVLAGTAHVFGVVGYDISSKSYFVYSYSIMDDDYQRFEDYSYSTGSYDDNQSGVIPFEIPDDINDLVNQRVFETDGLEVSANGTITAYTGSDTYVAIPDYKVINNKDGSRKVVRVTGLERDVFRGNKKITGVKLSQYIKEIPAGAFEGCTDLWQVDASATKIGDNAFKNCPLLNQWSLSNKVTSLGEHAFDGADSFAVKAYDTDIVKNALQSGAKEITVGLSELDGSTPKKTLKDTTLEVPEGTESVYLNGYGKEFENLSINSQAGETVLNRLNINTSKGIPVMTSASKVLINQCNIKSSGIAAALTADHLTLDLYGESNLETTGPYALLMRDSEVVRTTSGLKTSLNLKGDLVTCGTVSDPSKYIDLQDSKMVTVSRSHFDKMLRSFTLNLDPNGGTCDTESIVVDNATGITQLPTATREGYDLDGWYLSNGEKITSSTAFATGEDQTATARWKVKEFTTNWKNGNGVSIEVKRTASPLKEAATGTLNSGDTVYYGDKLSVSYTAQDGYHLGNTGASELTVKANVTDSDIYAMVGKISADWVKESDVPGGADVLDEKWTYDQKTTITSSNSSVAGYTPDHSTYVWSDYGGWSGWSNSKVTASDSRQVETKNIPATYKTQYNYSRYTQYSNNSGFHGPTKGTWSGIYCQYYFEKGWSDSALSVSSTQTSNQAGTFNLYGNNQWYNQTTRQVQVTAAYTQYRYRDRSKIYTYYLTKTETMESTTQPKSSSTISNVQRWVKYVDNYTKA